MITQETTDLRSRGWGEAGWWVVGRWKLQQLLEVGAAAYNLVRLRRLKPV